MLFTLKQLRYFVALAESRHFGRAAERCHVTQPALSMQIRELEAGLGLTLVERGPSGPLLTVEGAEALSRARGILLAADDLSTFARRRQRLWASTLRLGIIPSVGPYLLPQILPGLHLRFPSLRVALKESRTQNLVDDLVEGRLDLLLLALPVEREEVETLSLLDDPFVFVVPAHHRLAGRRRVHEADLADERLLLLEEGHCLRDHALALCRGAARDHAEEFGATSLATIVQMVASGYGCTLLPELALAAELGNRRGVRLLRFAEPAPRRSIGLAWRRSSPQKPDYRLLGEAVVELLRTEEDGSAEPALAQAERPTRPKRARTPCLRSSSGRSSAGRLRASATR